MFFFMHALYYFLCFLKHVHVLLLAKKKKPFFLSFSRATPAAHGDSQARGLIRAVAAGLRQGHSNVGSKPGLQPTPQLTAMPDP